MAAGWVEVVAAANSTGLAVAWEEILPWWWKSDMAELWFVGVFACAWGCENGRAIISRVKKKDFPP